MADQNTPQNAPQAPVPPTNQQVESFGTALVNQVKELWAKYSIFFIIVGALLLVAKFGNVLMDLLAYFSKKDVEAATKKSDQLKSEEDAANKQANDLVKKANDLPNQEGPVDENWDRKK